MEFMIILIPILANIGVFKFGVNSTTLLLILGVCLGAYKSNISENRKDIFNTYTFIIKFKSKENMLELLGAFLISIIFFSDEIITKQFGLFELFFLIMCTLLNYRFLFYNLSGKSKNGNR
ncbi:hypothetical protein [Clostridium vincentii]|uniref:Uncharacterized protein n=1 Tax=Clostridium vincentii TaxID=52704 RepID=A0A2T0BHV5_9CLOT|nr:hypothetical protein [Clostridium vincentii]PRR83480.1 hypothetical protein CLVI_10290 [Clostridium vincentii]